VIGLLAWEDRSLLPARLIGSSGLMSLGFRCVSSSPCLFRTAKGCLSVHSTRPDFINPTIATSILENNTIYLEILHLPVFREKRIKFRILRSSPRLSPPDFSSPQGSKTNDELINCDITPHELCRRKDSILKWTLAIGSVGSRRQLWQRRWENGRRRNNVFENRLSRGHGQ
jgi:hypothetical protein